MKRLGLTKIFWKIFATFWLVNIAVIFSASYVIVNSLENSRFIDLHQEAAKTTAEALIERYERGEPLRGPGMRRFMGGPGPRPDGPRPQVRILDESGNVIFQHRFGGPHGTPDYQMNVVSGAGNSYTVEAELPKPPLFLKEMLRRLQSTQFILIFLASTLASALLSYSISRPLKKLGASSREVARGTSNVAIDNKLLKRGDEVGDLARDFDHMIHQVDASLNSQRQLLHDVSHELRAPLARLQAAAALLEKTPDNPNYIEKIHNECGRMNGLIQQILDFSRLNQQHENSEAINIVDLFNQVIDELCFQYPERDIVFTPEHSSITFNGFRDSLNRVATNLLSNALKFSPSDKTVELELELGPKDMVFRVRDQGTGIAEDELARLTEPFFRSVRHGATDGFGLGLSIVKRGVLKHNGEVLFSNVEGGGFLVEVRLPVGGS